MTRRSTCALALAFTVSMAAFGQDRLATAEAPGEPLTKVVSWGGLRADRLLPMLARVEKTHGLRIGVDRAELEKHCKRSLDEIVLDIPPGDWPLGLSLEFVACQVRGTLRQIDGQWRIVPGEPDFGRFLSPASDKTRNAIRELAEIEKRIDNVPVNDVFEYFCEKYGVNIVAAGLGENGQPLGKASCTVAATQKPLIEIIEAIARQIEARVTIHKEGVLVVRDRRQP